MGNEFAHIVKNLFFDSSKDHNKTGRHHVTRKALNILEYYQMKMLKVIEIQLTIDQTMLMKLIHSNKAWNF